MKSLRRLVGFSSLLLVFGVAACSPRKEPPKPQVSAEPGAAKEQVVALPAIGPAPAWELKDLNGNVVSSEQFAGKVVVVDFWATWCAPCRAEIPGYIALQQKYGKDGLAIVGLSVDQVGPEVVKSFAEKNGVNYTMLMADDKVVAAFGGVEAIPTTFIVDRQGNIRDRKEGALETAEYEKRILAVLN